MIHQNKKLVVKEADFEMPKEVGEPILQYIVVKESSYGNFYVEADNKGIADEDVAIDLKNALQKLADEQKNKTTYYVCTVCKFKKNNLEVE
jgi:hypothetical protein|tara:strand:+ start:3647 stop:3919 length:273 start_codon:yes stop_codon:yes gene_type:complete